MEKVVFFIIVLIFSNFSSQLKLNIQLEKDSQTKVSIINVTIINNGQENIVFPLNDEGITPFFDGETCRNDQEISDSYSILPIIALTQKANLLKAERGLHHMEPLRANRNLKQFDLYDKLIFLKPNQKHTYKINFDPHEFYDNPYKVFYWYYKTEKDNNYNISLKFCIQNRVFKNLSKSQKEKISKYKLFSGKLESNIIVYTDTSGFAPEYIN